MVNSVSSAFFLFFHTISQMWRGKGWVGRGEENQQENTCAKSISSQHYCQDETFQEKISVVRLVDFPLGNGQL